MSYIQGFVVPVPTANKAKYHEVAVKAAAIFKDYGATQIVEAWGDDIHDGTTTDFKMAVKAKADETVVFSWIIWPDKATYQAAEARMETDDRFKAADMPFDGRRMIFGGFVPLFDSAETAKR